MEFSIKLIKYLRSPLTTGMKIVIVFKLRIWFSQYLKNECWLKNLNVKRNHRFLIFPLLFEMRAITNRPNHQLGNDTQMTVNHFWNLFSKHKSRSFISINSKMEQQKGSETRFMIYIHLNQISLSIHYIWPMGQFSIHLDLIFQLLVR